MAEAIGVVLGCSANYDLKEFTPMALSQSAVSDLLEAFRAGEGVDLVRESVRLVLQELIEAEAAQVIGAGRYERSRSEPQCVTAPARGSC